MRVAFLSYQWPGLRMGGIGSYVRQSAAALALAGHQAHVFTIGDGEIELENVPPGVVLHQTAGPASQVGTGQLSAELAAVVSTGGEAIYRLAIGWLLTDAFSKEHAGLPFDMVEVADVDASGLPLLLDAGRSLPVVVHLHTCTAIANRIHRSETNPQDQLIEAMEAAQIQLADAVCAPTNAVVRSTRELIPLDREPAIIPHPFVCGEEAFTLPPIDGPILFVGRLEWRKGCGVIAEMLGEFLARHPAARIRFIGPDTSSASGGGSVRRFIENAIVTRASGPCGHSSDADNPHVPEAPLTMDQAEFTGELSAAQVRAELRDCSFCILPSLSENFSVAICEAMAAGRATVVAGGTGSVEVLGDAGVAVEPGSAKSLLAAMSALYLNRAHLNQLSQKAFDRVRSLCDPIAVSNQRVLFYQNAIDQFKGRSGSTASDRLMTLPLSVAAAVLPCMSRMTAALMRVDESGDSPGARLAVICQNLSAGKPVEVLLYGAGKHTARLLSERHRWERHGHRVIGLIDDHPRFLPGKTYLGLPVKTRAEVEAIIKTTAIVLSTDTYEDQFWEQTSQLRELGAKVFRLYGPD